MDLNILRKEIKQKRLSLDYQKFELYNLEINNTIINSKIYNSSKVVYCYCSVNNIAPKPDIVIVPGLAFTKEGKRIGYGAGFYDRYLKNIDTYKIGVGFNFQIVDELKQHENDINLDTIITNQIV